MSETTWQIQRPLLLIRGHQAHQSQYGWWEVTCKSLAGHDPRRQFLEPRGLLVRHDVHVVCGVEHESIELEVFLGEISRGPVECLYQPLRNLFCARGRSPDR